MQTYREHWRSLWLVALIVGGLLAIASVESLATVRLKIAQGSQKALTPLQLEIEKQRTRLSSAEGEERRDAVVRLGSMHHPEASRLAVSALKDPLATVRATAAMAILSLRAEDSAANLIPLLADKDEFVRREAAYALGKTRNPTAMSFLVDRLLTDKKDEVRGAAAVALGEIKDTGAVSPLVSVLGRQFGSAPSKKSQKRKKEQNAFVLRAAAQSLGQIGSRDGLAALIAVLEDEKAEDDVRREAATALGLIADESALPALRSALTAKDPYLAEAADKAIRKIQRAKPPSGN